MDNKTQSLTEVTKLLPKKVKKWQLISKGEFYDGQSIYDYMDGAGEVYKQYNFKQLYSRRFERAGYPAITLEIFDMGSSEDAYGIFSHTRSGDAINIGQGGADMGSAIGFWKGKLFIYISTEKETSHSREAMLSLANMVEKSIQETGLKPRLLDLLPKENLAEDQIHYSRSFILSNTHYFIATENILEIDSNIEVVIAPYRDQDRIFYLILIQYPEENCALNAKNNFLKYYRPESTGSALFQIEDGIWCGVKRDNNFLIIILESESQSQTQQMLQYTAAKIQNSMLDIE